MLWLKYRSKGLSFNDILVSFTVALYVKILIIKGVWFGLFSYHLLTDCNDGQGNIKKIRSLVILFKPLLISVSLFSLVNVQHQTQNPSKYSGTLGFPHFQYMKLVICVRPCPP